MEQLGPATEVQKKLGELDTGKSVNATEFWAQVGLNFSPGKPGILQITEAITAIQAKKPKPDKPAADDPAKDKKDDPPPMMKWAEAQAQFEALKGDGALEALLGQLGAQPGGDLGGNQQALLEKRKKDVEALAPTDEGQEARGDLPGVGGEEPRQDRRGEPRGGAAQRELRRKKSESCGNISRASTPMA